MIAVAVLVPLSGQSVGVPTDLFAVMMAVVMRLGFLQKALRFVRRFMRVMVSGCLVLVIMLFCPVIVAMSVRVLVLVPGVFVNFADCNGDIRFVRMIVAVWRVGSIGAAGNRFARRQRQTECTDRKVSEHAYLLVG